MVLAAALAAWVLLTRSPFPDQESPEVQAIRSAVLEYKEQDDERSVSVCNVKVLGFESAAGTPWKAYVALICGNYTKIGDGLCHGADRADLDVYSLRSVDDQLAVVDLIGVHEFGDPERFFPPDIAALISRNDQRLWPPADDLQERAEALLFGGEAADGNPEGGGEPPRCPSRYF
jgi:hypothetical protein